MMMVTIDTDMLKIKIWHHLTGRITYDDLINWIDKQPTIEPKQEWISVKDRLPKRKREYLCVCQFGDDSSWRYYNVLLFHPEKNADNGCVKGPHFSNEGMDDMRVTHWMPLPEPPKED